MRRGAKSRRPTSMIPEPDGGALLASIVLIAIIAAFGMLHSGGAFP